MFLFLSLTILLIPVNYSSKVYESRPHNFSPKTLGDRHRFANLRFGNLRGDAVADGDFSEYGFSARGDNC